jgi:hypothetical protein
MTDYSCILRIDRMFDGSFLAGDTEVNRINGTLFLLA